MGRQTKSLSADIINYSAGQPRPFADSRREGTLVVSPSGLSEIQARAIILAMTMPHAWAGQHLLKEKNNDGRPWYEPWFEYVYMSGKAETTERWKFKIVEPYLD